MRDKTDSGSGQAALGHGVHLRVAGMSGRVSGVVTLRLDHDSVRSGHRHLIGANRRRLTAIGHGSSGHRFATFGSAALAYDSEIVRRASGFQLDVADLR